MSWEVFDVDSGTDRVATSTTDTSLVAGGGFGSDFGCTEVGVSATGWPLLTSLSDGVVLATDRFGFFGRTAVVEVSEPDFLSFTVAAEDFFPLPPVADLSPTAAVSLPSAVEPASSPSTVACD
jgi:hypothetical protein